MALWAALSPLLLRAESRPDFSPGDITTVDVTLVADDARDLACGLDATAWGHGCAFDGSGRPRARGLGPPLVPCLTPDRRALLVPGLFEQSRIAERVARDASAYGSRHTQARFTARCRVRVMGEVHGVRTRYVERDPFTPPGDAWVVAPLACDVVR
ncbi:MAG: hypothetical protein IPI67_33540 [Myxococcales bacterium]|nr:hypothetical protein [Myxococcales bacterium]